MTFQLRDYQQRAVDEVRAAWDQHRRVLLALPTGAGKTEIAISLASEASPADRVLVVVDKKVLCKQWYDRFYKHNFDNVGVLQGENTVATWAPVLIATAQTLRARGIPEGVGLVIVDESHVWHQTHDRVLEQTRDAKVLGLSATPLREGLGHRFDKLLVGATIRELTEAGHLVPARVFAPTRHLIAEALEQIGVRGGDYVADQLSKLMRKKAVIGDVITNWRDKAEGRQTIAFCVDKAHARDLADQFTLDGIPAAVVVDETSDEDRADIFRKFEAGEIKVLTSVGVLGVGFDSPVASCAILARPTLSTMLHIQQAGRVIRPYPGKVDAVILDNAANTLRHGLPIDFVPPTELSGIERSHDRKSRVTECGELVCCKNCEAIYPRSEDACPECGTPRTRFTKLVVLDGRLKEVTWESDKAEPNLHAPTPEAVQKFYREMLGIVMSKGWKPGAAWFKTAERFNLDSDFHKPDSTMNQLLSRSWRTVAQAEPPSNETMRWFDNQRKRYFVKTRYEGQRRDRDAA